MPRIMIALPGCNPGNVNAVRHAIAATDGVHSCAIFRFAKDWDYAAAIDVISGHDSSEVSAAVEKSLSPHGVEVVLATQVSPVEVQGKTDYVDQGRA